MLPPIAPALMPSCLPVMHVWAAPSPGSLLLLSGEEIQRGASCWLALTHACRTSARSGRAPLLKTRPAPPLLAHSGGCRRGRRAAAAAALALRPRRPRQHWRAQAVLAAGGGGGRRRRGWQRGGAGRLAARAAAAAAVDQPGPQPSKAPSQQGAVGAGQRTGDARRRGRLVTVFGLGAAWKSALQGCEQK